MQQQQQQQPSLYHHQQQQPHILIAPDQFRSVTPFDFREKCIRVASHGGDSSSSVSSTSLNTNDNIEWLLDRLFQWIVQHIPVATTRGRSSTSSRSSTTIPQELRNENHATINSIENNLHQQRMNAVVAVLLARFIRAIVVTHQHTFTQQQQQQNDNDDDGIPWKQCYLKSQQ
jgi:hypothetical protein